MARKRDQAMGRNIYRIATGLSLPVTQYVSQGSFLLGEGKQPNVCSQLRSQYKNVLLKRL